MWLLIWGGWGGWHKLRCVCIYACTCYETVSSAVAQGLGWFMLSWCDFRFTTCGVVEAPFSAVKTSLLTWVLLQVNCVRALILIKSLFRIYPALSWWRINSSHTVGLAERSDKHHPTVEFDLFNRSQILTCSCPPPAELRNMLQGIC